jgi:hypothetical protein
LEKEKKKTNNKANKRTKREKEGVGKSEISTQ